MPLIYSFSDHAPILLSTNGRANKTRTHFKFENWWLKEEDFQTYAKIPGINQKERPITIELIIWLIL
jgi:hypothetical protein